MGANQILSTDTWRQIPAVELNDERLKEALDLILGGPALSHPSDHRNARNLLAPHRRRLGTIDPVAVRAYVIRESNWQIITANELAGIAAGRGHRQNR